MSAAARPGRDQAARARRFRELHHGPAILLVPNAWDAVSARLVEQAGFPCVGTTSAGIAWSLGFADGERVPRDLMLEVVARIAGAVDLPVTADIEAGYGESPRAVYDTVRAAVAAGAVGVNLEDATGDPQAPLYDVTLQAERVAAAREAADRRGVRAVVNARTDVFWLRHGPPETRRDMAVERFAAFGRAGADCAFAPGLTERDTIGYVTRACRELGLPLNVLATPESPAVAALAALGVARVSVGSGLARLALAGLRAAAEHLRDAGSLAVPGVTALPYAEVDALMAGSARA